jgi:hypothetical protein
MRGGLPAPAGRTNQSENRAPRLRVRRGIEKSRLAPILRRRSTVAGVIILVLWADKTLFLARSARDDYRLDEKIEVPRCHIDYCFVPVQWAKRILSVTVSDFGEWVGSGLSYHVPLIVDVKENAA